MSRQDETVNYVCRQDFALGNYGFGHRSTEWRGNVYYDWTDIFLTRESILAQQVLLIHRVKKSYRDRFKIIIKFLKNFPNIPASITTTIKDFSTKPSDYFEREIVKKAILSSAYVRNCADLRVKLETNGVVCYEYNLLPDVLELVIKFSHILDKINNGLTAHINLMEKYTDRIKAYKKEKPYLDILELIKDLKLIDVL